MYHFYVQGEVMEKGVPVPATVTEQQITFRSTNKAHGKLTGVNLVFYQCCDYRHFQQGCHFQVSLFICAVQRDKYDYFANFDDTQYNVE